MISEPERVLWITFLSLWTLAFLWERDRAREIERRFRRLCSGIVEALRRRLP